MNPVGEGELAEQYARFGTLESDDSPTFSAWALGVAADPDVLGLVASLPEGKQQPNLVFAAARWHGASGPSYDELRVVLRDRWDDVRTTVLQRATQTNEVARCATLLPVLAGLPGPLALLEVGASAGLTLFPDRCSYRYATPDGEVALDPVDGPSPVVLHCEVEGPVPLPAALPRVVWRGGIDLNPLDVHDDDAMAWLRTLVWPEHDDRRARLAAAVGLVRQDPPVLVRGDLVEELPGLVAQVPQDATLVVFHSAVLAYLPAAERRRFVSLVQVMPGHWVSNEGPRVVPLDDVPPEPAASVAGTSPLLVRLDGSPVAWAHGHGRGVRGI